MPQRPINAPPAVRVVAVVWGRGAALLVALASAAAALWLAAHHPLSGGAALASVVLVAAVVAAWPSAWLIGLPALWPWIGLAPWTGWITLEETDLLVLAVAAGGYARWALRPGPAGPPARAASVVGWLLLALWAAAVLLATQRGVADAGGFVADWYQGYRGPMNALRLAKPTLAVLLLLPLWQRALQAPGGRAPAQLTLGLALASAGIALACLWERLTYPGLLNFSADYRSTGPFWEMHVGGAALDGLLALTLPFAWLQLQTTRSRLGWVLAALAVLLGAYAAITTFSRIVLLALPLGIGLMLVLQRWAGGVAPLAGGMLGAAQAGLTAAPSAAPTHTPHTPQAPITPTTPTTPTTPQAAHPAHPALAAALLLGVSAAAAWMFSTSGYRGMLALLGNAALLLLLAPRLRALGRREWAAAAALALAGGPVLIVGAALLLAKGPYLLHAGLVLGSAAAVLLAGGRTAPPARGQTVLLALAGAGYAVALASTVLVAWHWGGGPALAPALQAVGGLALVSVACVAWPRPLWPADARWQGGMLVAMVVAAGLVGVFGGGAYMAERLSTASSDEQGRWQHWRSVLSRLPDAQARWLGQGLGRFVEAYAISADPGTRPGDLRWIDSDTDNSGDNSNGANGRSMARLIAGTHVQGWGELLRLSQRIARPAGLPVVRLTLRNADATELWTEVCLKHLLYTDICQAAHRKVPASAGGWQTVTLALGSKALPDDLWALPRFTVFSLATESSARPIEVSEISLTDAQGRQLIHNGRFEQGGARWFFSSDRNHLPWHAKNMVVHLLFEQGIVGLAAFGLLGAVAFGRLLLGQARRHALAPALAGALLGTWVVGMVDSLLDMPRLATLMLLLTLVAVTLPARPRLPPLPASAARPQG